MSILSQTKSYSHTTRTPIYLDCNATTPIDPEVESDFLFFIREEFGNAGSRTHEFGTRAKQAVQKARDQVAAVVKCQREEVIFTSGATESNNLAILGLREHGEKTGKRHIVSTAIEHKAVLEPLEYLASRGFSVTFVKPESNGSVAVEKIAAALRPNTLLVSVMHVNNETGIIQPIGDIASTLKDYEAFFHVDAAQGFGKRISDLQNPRIDLISISGHKVFAPKGIGALVTRRRGYNRPPLTPLVFGGGQERGLRPGTQPVALIVALGKAAELCLRDHAEREARSLELKAQALAAFREIGGIPTGDQSKALPTTLNVAIPGLDSEAVMVALKDIIAISNGSACTSQSYTASHVLTAMGLSEDHTKGALRLSWCHLTPDVPWDRVVEVLRSMQ
ncbi:MAG TPA: cysteine desulfurase DndA [Candidatus Paceibacterota bacterium]|nr:cysteine desulfurase DndA [Verrucomicrobiota bacterium]HRY51561.1 cysteine desulfurase DndA [Candidatus Paceibacterota bacterium]